MNDRAFTIARLREHLETFADAAALPSQHFIRCEPSEGDGTLIVGKTRWSLGELNPARWLLSPPRPTRERARLGVENGPGYLGCLLGIARPVSSLRQRHRQHEPPK